MTSLSELGEGESGRGREEPVNSCRVLVGWWWGGVGRWICKGIVLAVLGRVVVLLWVDHRWSGGRETWLRNCGVR